MSNQLFADSSRATPYYSRRDIYLYPIIVRTRPGFKGGLVSYAKTRREIERLCRQHGNAHVSTLFDLYGLPSDFPGKRLPAYTALANGQRKAEFLEAELARNIGRRNFIPNLLVHEFEALLFTDIRHFEPWADDDGVLAPLHAVRRTTPPEDINDNARTTPSKRILAAMPDYQKTVHGPLIACDIGLDAIRGACPHFDGWLRKLEGLG